jgi:hypothetical protein
MLAASSSSGRVICFESPYLEEALPRDFLGALKSMSGT